MTSLIVLERHLWLTMMEMKEADKGLFLHAPVLSGSLFGPAVEGIAERFTEAKKLSQVMQHFLPKHTSSSSASSRSSAQSFSENAGPYGSGFAGSSVGSASHATHQVLAEAEGSIRGLASRTPPRNGDSACVSALVCWRDPFWLKRGVILDTQKEACW